MASLMAGLIRESQVRFAASEADSASRVLDSEALSLQAFHWAVPPDIGHGPHLLLHSWLTCTISLELPIGDDPEAAAGAMDRTRGPSSDPASVTLASHSLYLLQFPYL